ncbi:ABC transporter permease [Halapricum desulfuricans]|uniref:ABC-type Fe3+ transport system, permease component n=1 Tax=Halapricum desulfuricans TaxID=2841257 RepID=A0A897N792_9EURY|nr:iron ABC transporter permease [Halapricum desulfuricans]QSG06256.1 ABC-type Fe3+ transport system, permease component [Halapricum desulfuricans]
MSVSDRIDAASRRLKRRSRGDVQTLVLALLAGSVAVAVLTPLLWVLNSARSVPLDRFFDILFRQTTLDIFLNTVVLVVAVTALSVLIGVPLAVLTAQTDLPFRRLFTVLAALPLVVPSYIGAFAFVSAFGPRGELADALAPLGVEQIPSIYGLVGSVIVLTLFTYPYVFLTTRASLLSIDGRTVEAARTLNHTRLEAFRRVTLPQLKPGIAAGALLVALYTLSDFGTPAIMQFDVFTRIIYVRTTARQVDFASIFSILLVALTVVILLAESRIERGGETSAYVNRGTDRPGVVRLGRWRWVATLFPLAVAALALALPPAILFAWLGRSTPELAGAAVDFQWEFAWNSVTASALAAGASVLAALPLAYLSARGDGRLSSLPERASYVGYAVPGVVVGFGLLSVALNATPFLYGSLAVLVFAYVVRFLPQAVGTTRSSILQVDPQLLEAARTLGKPPLVAFRTVVLPLVMPGIVAGAALVFLTSMKELAATLLLRPFGFETLVTYIWQVQEAAAYGQAAVPALVLIGISALSMLVILGRERYDVKE